MKRTLARGSVLLAAASLAATVIVIAPANAVTVSQTCKKFTGTVTIKPGLTTTPGPQTASAVGTLSGCTASATTGGSGTIKATLKLPATSSCQGLATGKQTVKIPTSTITWKNKKTSSMTLTAVTGSGATATTATITGKVTKSLFAGKSVTAAIKVTPKSGENCSPGHPIQHLTFTNPKPFVIH
jgi:hypothetical protein